MRRSVWMSGLLAGIIATLAWALVPSTLVPIHFSTPTAATIPTRHPSGAAVVGTDTIPAFQPAGFLAAWPVNFWLLKRNLKNCH